MLKIDTTSSPALAQVKCEWNFIEVWIEPLASPPYLLLLLGDSSGGCHVCDPAENYRIVFSAPTYDEAENWLLEDEFEPFGGRLLASDL